MPTPDWDALEPTPGTPGNSYEVGLDLFIGAAWLNVPDITDLNPSPAPRTRNRSTYASKGRRRNSTYARDVDLTFRVEIVRDPVTNQYQPELQYLLDKADMLGEDNRTAARWFDTLGADYAREGEFTVEHSRANTGSDEEGFFGFTLSSYGQPVKIPNPVNDGLAPGIVSALPPAAAAGAAIFIEGIAFTGTTSVTIGGTAATGITVIDDRHLRVIVPAGAAGSAPIIVTTDEGPSLPLPYVRG